MKFDSLKSKSQKGAYIVLAALMVPVALLFGALAADFGEIWAYHAKLQNAVDAAALAGAAHYNSISDPKDVIPEVGTIDTANHGHADGFAKLYLEQNLNVSQDQLNKAENHTLWLQVQTVKKITDEESNASETKSYYRVEYTQPVPLIFLRYIGIDSFNVKAAAVAVIPQSKTEVPDEQITFDNLMYVGKEMFGSYTNGFLNQITATFDGHVVLYNDSKYREIFGSSWNWQKAYYQLPTLAARGLNISDKSNPKYFQNVINGARDENGNLIRIEEDGYWYSNPYDYFNHKVTSAIQTIFNSAVSMSGDHTYYFTSNGIKDNKGNQYSPNGNYYMISGENQWTDTIDVHVGAVKGTDPLYIYVNDNNVSQIHLIVDEDVGFGKDNQPTRPIIFCYTNNRADIKFDGYGGHRYRGVIYAPYARQLGPFNNINVFYGSMVSNRYQLNTNNMDYRYEKFGIPSNSGGGGSSGQNIELKLISNHQEGLSWPESHNSYLNK